ARRGLVVEGAYLCLRRGDALVGTAAAGSGANDFCGLRRSLTDSLIGHVYRAADVLVVNDFPHSLYNQQFRESFAGQAMLAVPLRRGDRPVGVLLFADNVGPHRFTTTLRERALIFGAQTTVAIESALAREREEEEGRVSAALLHVTSAVRESLEEDQVLRAIGRTTRDVLGCDWSLVTMWDPAAEAFRVAAAEGWPPDIEEELRVVAFSPGELHELRGLLAHETVEVREPPVDTAPLYQRWQITSLLAAPMLRGSRHIGTLLVGHRTRRGPFSAREHRIITEIATKAAIAVENARLVEELRRANQLKSEFLATMSHELRTPLNAMLGYAELMRDRVMGSISEEQADALERIVANGISLLELINMILDANRLEGGRPALEASEFTLQELLATLRGEFAVRTAAGAVTVSWPDVTDQHVLHTDRGKLKLVLRNLIDNALKFTPQGYVGVTVGGDEARVRVQVKDTGVGIPHEAQSAVFEMFRQLDGPPRSSRAGVGLGLYLVQRYTQMLGGRVTLESTPGAGSIFTVDVPRNLQGTGSRSSAHERASAQR
ncbi:MAG: GAF domain-containing sensor histidine kinase, partial [Candidatus Binatia bacterium]